MSLTDVSFLITDYDFDNITIATLGSHSALQILHGAKLEGFSTLLIVEKKREWFYDMFSNLIDFKVVVDSWKDICKDRVLSYLRKHNSILIPHGSLIEYVGLENVEKMRLPIFGLRSLFRIEANQRMKMEFLRNAGIKIPKEYTLDMDINSPVIIKFPGAKGGKGYFIAKTKEEVIKGIREAISQGIITSHEDVMIQEYIVGVTAYYHFFYSPTLRRLEILGADIRYESNIDGLYRLPPDLRESIRASFTVVGNIPLVLRESLLPKIMRYGLNFVKYSQITLPPGIIGPFCLESVIKDDGEIVVFEFSGRIVAGTNLYVTGSPYSSFYWNEPMSVGRRIAREIRLALEKDMLHKVIT